MGFKVLIDFEVEIVASWQYITLLLFTTEELWGEEAISVCSNGGFKKLD